MLIFLPSLQSSRPRSSSPSNVYYTFGHSVYSITPLSILPTPSQLLQGGGGSKSVKYGLDLRHYSSLNRPHFETK